MDFTIEEFIYIALWTVAMSIIYLIVHDDYEDDDDDDDDN